MHDDSPWGLIDIRPIVAAAGAREIAVAEVATLQHGCITAAQLGFIGWGRGTLPHHAEQGRLHRIHRGVYLVGHRAHTDLADLTGAVLACGRESVLSHLSAAWLWGLLATLEGAVQVSVRGSGRRQREGICVHRTTALDKIDVRRRNLIPITSPERTILDVAEDCGSGAAEHVLNEARLKRLVLRSHMIALYRRSPGRRGWRVLRPLLREDATDDFSRQAAEKALNRLVRSAGLPRPRRNVRVHGFELDFYWPDLRLNVEVDGYQWHSARQSNNSDRDRDTLLAASGIQVVRFSRDQLRFEPNVVLARLAAAIALAERRASAA